MKKFWELDGQALRKNVPRFMRGKMIVEGLESIIKKDLSEETKQE